MSFWLYILLDLANQIDQLRMPEHMALCPPCAAATKYNEKKKNITRSSEVEHTELFTIALLLQSEESVIAKTVKNASPCDIPK